MPTSNFNIFNANFQMQTQQQTAVTEFRPNPKKGQNGVFKAVVRFIPNLEDPMNKSIISKYCAYIKDPKTQQSRAIDCPSSIGAPDPIANTFFALRNSKNPILEENSKNFSRKQTFAAYVQVISCESDPSIVNKILVWRFGTKVNEKLTEETNPEIGEPHYPFNLTEGRPFSVIVKEVGGYTNYDSCSFKDAPIAQGGMRIMHNGQLMVVTPELIQTAEGQQAVIEYIKQNAPDITRYEYHEWSEEDRKFVNEAIQIYSNPQASIAALSAAQNPGGAVMPQQTFAQQASAVPTASPVTPAFPSMGAPIQQSAPTMGLGANSVNPTDPRGFNAQQLPGDISNLVGGAQTAPATGSEDINPQQIGLSINDILSGGTMF